MEIKNIEQYEEMLDRINYKNICEYLKKNQGVDFENILENYKENEEHFKILLNIWIERWTTFSQGRGRIVKNNEKYYCLSPINPNFRDRNPVVNIL